MAPGSLFLTFLTIGVVAGLIGGLAVAVATLLFPGPEPPVRPDDRLWDRDMDGPA